MATEFPPAPQAGFQPTILYGDMTPNDPRGLLPASAAKKFTALVQRATDIRSTTPKFEDISEAAKLQTVSENRIALLLRPRPEGGMGQAEDAPSVLDQRKKLERATAELNRLQEVADVRNARWSGTKRLEQNCIDWVIRGGIPGGTTLAAVDDEPITALLKKGERISEAVERYRHRLRELAADLHRVRSSPWPSSLAKERAKAQIMALAQAAEPDYGSMIEHGSPLTFPMVSLQSFVHGVETPAIGFTEAADSVGLMCYLFRDQLLAKINAGIDAVSDDKAALNERQRAEMEAQIAADALVIERLEVACIWHAEAKGEILDFRSDTSVLAALGLRLIHQTHANGGGSSLGHAFDVLGSLGRR